MPEQSFNGLKQIPTVGLYGPFNGLKQIPAVGLYEALMGLKNDFVLGLYQGFMAEISRNIRKSGGEIGLNTRLLRIGVIFLNFQKF